MAPGLQPFYDGWANYQRLLVAALRELTPEHLALRTAPHQWAVWQIAGHMAGARTYWFHDVLGEGDPAIRDMFRVASTTVPDLPPAMDAGRPRRRVPSSAYHRHSDVHPSLGDLAPHGARASPRW
jgi:uncharacterized damage-inducible protein DinB